MFLQLSIYLSVDLNLVGDLFDFKLECSFTARIDQHGFPSC